MDTEDALVIREGLVAAEEVTRMISATLDMNDAIRVCKFNKSLVPDLFDRSILKHGCPDYQLT